MSQIFPKWTNKLPAIIVAAVIVIVISVVGFFWYYGSPKYTDVGYRPMQPVTYSHKLHAGDLGLDCRYCHSNVERSPIANVPPTQTCMNCHKLILPQSEKLLPVRESWSTGQPIRWVRVHELPDYAYFNHSAHLNAGVGCAELSRQRRADGGSHTVAAAEHVLVPGLPSQSGYEFATAGSGDEHDLDAACRSTGIRATRQSREAHQSAD